MFSIWLTGYCEGVVLFIVNNGIFPSEDIRVVITLLRMDSSVQHCGYALNITLYRAQNVYHSVLDKMFFCMGHHDGGF